MISLRIPRKSLYRAFRELDPFTDEQCERFVQRVRVAGTYPYVVCLAILVTSIPALIAVCAILARADALQRFFSAQLDPVTADVLMIACWIIFPVGVPLLLGLVVRDIVVRVYLRRAIRVRIARVRCVGCKYLLIGQRVTRNIVSCPECGAQAHLMDLGLTPQDLVSPEPTTPA
jgi:hypothetical protein